MMTDIKNYSNKISPQFIIGHQKQIDLLKKIFISRNIPQALLFSGQERLGKKKIALSILSKVLEDKPLNHPDFVLIEPKDGTIQINQIRELNKRIALKPLKSSIKAALIDQAHLMTREAQNAFLKTLEEPRGKTLLILVSEYASTLLPTIRSRCEIIRFYPVKKELIEDYLKQEGLDEKKVRQIEELSFGRPGLAISLLKNPDQLRKKEKIIKEAEMILNLSLPERFQYVKEISQSKDLGEILTTWLIYFRKRLISSSEDISQLRMKRILETIQKIYFLISTTNVNQRLALEMLMMEI